MAQISRLARLVAGIWRQVDLTTNTLVVQDITVGGLSGTTLTKTILDTLTGGGDASSLHNHDTQYFTKAQLGSTTAGSSGAKDIGVSGSPANYTAATADVQAHLAGIDTKLGTVASAAITALTGDVTASGPGSAAATVALVGGSSAANVHSAELAANAATDLNTTGKIVKRDGSGNFSAGTITASLTGHASLDLALTGGTMSGDIAMGGHKVSGLGAPSTNGDALRFDQLGANSGIATLDSGGKIPLAQLPASLMEYQGTWNASTNSPALADGTGVSGYFYRVQVAGTQNLGSGAQTFVVGDWVMYNGAIWQLAHSGADAVISVNGAAGAVTVNAINQLTGDVTASAAAGSQSKATTVAAIAGTAVAGTTGTGNVMFSASPTTTGTLTAAAISASGAITGSNLSGTNTGDQTITLTGDVTGSGTGSFAATIAANAVTDAKLRLTNTGTLRARNAANSGDVNILHVDASNTTQFDQLPQANFTPAAATDLTNKSYVDNLGVVKRSAVVGDATLTANTSYAVRWGKVANGETADRVYKADQDATTNDNFHVIGFVQAGGSGQVAGDTVTLYMLGAMTLASADSAFTTGMVGLPVYLNATGAFSTTAPTTANYASVIIGVVESTTKLFVQGRHIVGVN